MALTTHTTEQRAFIVWAIANCFDPKTIIQKFREEFKKAECTGDDINSCDPRRLTGDWLKYFEQERSAFYDAPNDKQFRMAILRRMLVENEGRNVHALALKAAELLAKEDAGFYTPKAAPGKGEALPGDKIDSSITWKIVDPDGGV
jgi:hypothetical protein